MQRGSMRMKKVAEFLTLWFVMGMCYAQLELFVRGFTYLPMTFIGGLAGASIGALDSHPSARSLRMWQQCLLGMMIVLDIEFISGCIFNLGLHMSLWDYSRYRYNLLGQICLPLGMAWFFITPSAAWVDDFIRWRLFGEDKPDTLFHNYLRLFMLK